MCSYLRFIVDVFSQLMCTNRLNICLHILLVCSFDCHGASLNYCYLDCYNTSLSYSYVSLILIVHSQIFLICYFDCQSASLKYSSSHLILIMHSHITYLFLRLSQWFPELVITLIVTVHFRIIDLFECYSGSITLAYLSVTLNVWVIYWLTYLCYFKWGGILRTSLFVIFNFSVYYL